MGWYGLGGDIMWCTLLHYSSSQVRDIEIIFKIKCFHIVFPSIGIGAAVANDNKALLLASTILYSLVSFVLIIAFCVMLKWMANCSGDYEDEEDGLGVVFCCLSRCPPTCLVSLVLAMEVTAAVCSGLLYKQ